VEFQDEFEDTKVVIRSYKTKEEQTMQWPREKTNNGPQNIPHKTKY
jgi:hypothetical protein